MLQYAPAAYGAHLDTCHNGQHAHSLLLKGLQLLCVVDCLRVLRVPMLCKVPPCQAIAGHQGCVEGKVSAGQPGLGQVCQAHGLIAGAAVPRALPWLPEHSS